MNTHKIINYLNQTIFISDYENCQECLTELIDGKIIPLTKEEIILENLVSNFQILAVNYLGENIIKYYVEMTVEKKFLFFNWNKTYKLHNIIQLNYFGMRNEFLVDDVIYFDSYFEAKQFIYDNYSIISNQGLVVNRTL